MNSRAVVLASMLSLALLLHASRALADLAPPGVESCDTLPEGARCFQRGVVPGHCVHESPDYPDIVQKICRSDPSPSASTSASASPIATSPLPTLPSAAPSSQSSSAHHGACSVAFSESPSLAPTLILLSLLVVRSARRRAS